MKNIYRHISALAIILTFVLVPVFGFAQSLMDSYDNGGGSDTRFDFGGVSSGGSGSTPAPSPTPTPTPAGGDSTAVGGGNGNSTAVGGSNTIGTDETDPAVRGNSTEVGGSKVTNTSAPVGGGTAKTGTPKYLITNPLGSKATSLTQVVVNVVSIVQILLVMASVLYILWAGIQFVTARGDTGKIKNARNALLWGFVGIILVLGAQVIVKTLENSISAVLK